MSYTLDFSTFYNIYFVAIRGDKMIDIYDSETLVKVYRMLSKKCEAIDNFIKEHALYFGPSTIEYGAEDVCNNMIDLLTRKNQLINLKIIVDNAVKRLSDNDKKILMIKMHYNLSMEEICAILELKERTVFRYIERAFLNLSEMLNKSKYCKKLEQIIDQEDWIFSIKQDIRSRRMAFKCRAVGV